MLVGNFKLDHQALVIGNSWPAPYSSIVLMDLAPGHQAAVSDKTLCSMWAAIFLQSPVISLVLQAIVLFSTCATATLAAVSVNDYLVTCAFMTPTILFKPQSVPKVHSHTL